MPGEVSLKAGQYTRTKPENPFDFYFSGNRKGAAPADVVLRAPVGASAATGLNGRAYLPDGRGLFDG
jgi:hypothetical protein